jgi:thioredoxin-dependent peroxiredoxin
MNPVDPPALSRVWFNYSLTGKRDERKAQMGKELKVGQLAPGFTLPRDGGGNVSLDEFKGRKLVLYFYPRADTPGCTREAIDFSKLRREFEKAETDILGVSADPVPAQDAFKKKHHLTISLLSDGTHRMLEAYGAWGKKSMYGKTFMGILRSTVLIGRDGRIARIWPKVKVDGHAADVLEAAKAL